MTLKKPVLPFLIIMQEFVDLPNRFYYGNALLGQAPAQVLILYALANPLLSA